MKTIKLLAVVTTIAAAMALATSAQAKKPNILIIWGDDVGWFNPSCLPATWPSPRK